MSKYVINLEVAGPLAIFSRPDTGATPTSYPVPTWSAAKGIFESIAFFADGKAWICPTKVAVCKRIGDPGGQIQYQRYTTNYGGPLRKSDLLSKGNLSGGSSMQLYATVLTDVCFRLEGIILGDSASKGKNPQHHLQDLFLRRLKRGQCHTVPRLGWSEFTCSYWGDFREGFTDVDKEINLQIPSMLVNVWSDSIHGQYEPQFQYDIEVSQGILCYPEVSSRRLCSHA
jgi:CRISPR-associated protein Cas5d